MDASHVQNTAQRIAQLEAELAALRVQAAQEQQDTQANPLATVGAELRLRVTLAAPDALFILDADGRYVDAMPQHPDGLVQPADHILGRTVYDLFEPALAREAHAAIQRALANPSQTVSFAYDSAGGDGAAGLREEHFTAQIVALDTKHVLVASYNQTLARDQQERLVQNEFLLRRIHKLARLSTAVLDVATGTFEVAPDLALMAHLPASISLAELVELLPDRVHPDDLPVLMENLNFLWVRPMQMEGRLRLPDGSYRYIRAESFVEQNEEGAPVRVLCILQDINDRVLAEAALAQAQVDRAHSQARADQIVQMAADAITILDAEGCITYESPSARMINGFPDEHFTGRNVFEFIHYEDLPKVQEAFRSILVLPASSTKVEYRFRHRDGNWVHFESLGTNLFHNPDVGGILVFSRDITARRLAENRLREREALLAEAQAIARLGYFQVDLETGSVRWTDEMYRLLYFPSNRPTPMEWELHELVAPEDRIGFRIAMATVRGGGSERMALDLRFIRQDGLSAPVGKIPIVWIRLHIRGVQDSEGKVVQLVGTLQDISAEMRTAATLRRTEQLTKAIYDQSADALFVVDANGRLLDCNQRAVVLFDAANKAELLAQQGFDTTGGYNTVLGPAEWLVTDGVPPTEEQELPCSTLKGIPFYGLRSVRLLQQQVAQAARQYLVRIADISEMRQQMDALQESRLLFRGMFDSAADALFLVSSDAKQILDCNTRALELFEAPDASMLMGTNLRHLQPVQRANNHSVWQIRKALRTAGLVRLELPFTSLKGRRFWGNVAVNRVQLPGRAFYIARIADETEVKMAQDALLQAEQRYRSIFENSIEGIFQSTLDGRFIVVNPPLVALLGYSSTEEVLAAKDLEQLYVNSSDRRALVETITRDGFVQNFEYQIRRRDGTVRWVSENSRLVLSADGELLYMEGALIDVHERKQAEEALREAEQLYRDIFHNAAEGIFQTYIDGTIRTVNPVYAKMLKYDSVEQMRSELGNRIVSIYYDPEDREKALQLIQQAPIRNMELRLRCRDGSMIWVLGSMRIVRNEQGAASHLEGSIIDITDRKAAEAELREREARLQALMQGLPVIVYKLDQQGKITLTEGRGMTSQGWNAEQLLGRSITDMYPDEQYLRYIRRALAGEEGLQWHTERNGLFFETRTTVIRDADGQVNELIAVEIDVTQRVWAEQLLRASESRFRSLSENAPDFIIIADADTWEVIYINRMEFLGWRSDVMTKSSRVLQQMHPDDMKVLLDNRRKLLKQDAGSFITTLVRYRNSKDEWEWLQIRETVLSYRETGRGRELLATVTIVTDQIRTQEALRQSESLYRTIIRHFPNGLILLMDALGKTLVAGGQLLPDFGYEPGQLIGRQARELLPGDFDPTPDATGMRLAEVQLRNRLHRVYTVPVLNNQGERVAGLLMSQDITEQKRFEQALRESEERFRALLQNSSDIILTMDERGNIRFVTPAVRRILGYAPETLQGTPLAELLHPEDRAAFDEAFRQALDDPSQPIAVEFRCQRRDGTYAVMDAQGGNLLTLEAVRAVVANLRDITDRTEAEDQLRASVREKEVLLQEIYHRVKNNLQVVSSLLEIQSDSVTDEATLRLLRDSQSRIYSIALVHEKLYQSRDLHNIDFRDYVSNLTAYVGQAFGGDFRNVQIDVNVDSLPINLDMAMRCGLVLNELISNALKYAFPDGRSGNIRIESRIEKGQLRMLSVTDDGVGLPDGKNHQSQNSLGLRLVGMIARQLRAKLEVTSGADGSTFALEFEPDRVSAN